MREIIKTYKEYFLNRGLYDFTMSKTFIFVSGLIVVAFAHWRHFFAAALLVDTTTIFLITFSYIIIFAISFIFTKIVSNFLPTHSGNRSFYVTWFFVQLALLAFFPSYVKYESRISVYHEVMKIAPGTGGIGVSDAVKQCQLFMVRNDWEQAYPKCLIGSTEGNSEAQTNLAYLYFEGLGPLEHAPDRPPLSGPR